MQYTQRKLHRSVTEIRRVSRARPNLSSSGSTGYRLARDAFGTEPAQSRLGDCPRFGKVTVPEPPSRLNQAGDSGTGTVPRYSAQSFARSTIVAEARPMS